MKKAGKLFILFFFILFLASPIFAAEAVEEDITPGEGVIKEPGEGVITGEVLSVDSDSGVIAVKVSGGLRRTFYVLTGETILWKGIEDIELSDVREGVEAEVGYYTDGEDRLIASWVDILVKEEVVPIETESEAKGSPKE